MAVNMEIPLAEWTYNSNIIECSCYCGLHHTSSCLCVSDYKPLPPTEYQKKYTSVLSYKPLRSTIQNQHSSSNYASDPHRHRYFGGS